MKSGKARELLDSLSQGGEKALVFRGRVLLIRCRPEGETWIIAVDQWEPPYERPIWKTEEASASECLEAFLSVPLFDSLTFEQAESEMGWISDEADD